MAGNVWILGGYQSDFARNLTREGSDFAALTTEVVDLTLAESMIDAGVALGLTRAQAAVLARQTIRGAGAMLTESGMTSTDLRAAVTSPGGTTAAAITELERGGLRSAMYSATAAAAAKSAKLSRRSEVESSTGNGGDGRD